MNLKFRFRMRASETAIEVVPAVLAESHPALRRLRSHLHESAARTGRGADEAARLADQAFAGFVARCMHTFGEAYLERVTTAIDRIYRRRGDISEQLNRILKGEAADFTEIAKAYADIDAVMPDVVAPDAATPPRISPEIVKAPQAAGAGSKPATKASAAVPKAPKAATPFEPLMLAMGDLSDAGVQSIRRRFKTVKVGKRSVPLSELSDAQIRERFPNQSAWLEHLVQAELGGTWKGRSSAVDFAMTNPKQSMRDVAARLQKAVAAGDTGHTVRPEVLELDAMAFVKRQVEAGDPVLAPAFKFLEEHPDPAVRQRWEEFKYSAKGGDMSGFLLGKVGDKRPDVVEVMLSQSEIHVLDASFAYQDPIHNFKTAFYRSVLEQMIDVETVTGTDYRAPFRQTPVGP